MDSNKQVRAIAFYLPQFHTIPENDEWWGKGFTEWTNVAKAKPLFPGHQQPKIPGELGFYDLRVPEVRERQAEMARNAGIAGFCYWHYWFGKGKRLLERPFQEVVKSGKPDFPFCLGWANHSWKRKTWIEARRDEMLIEQLYPGDEDYRDHFYAMLPAFRDDRYLRNNGKLIFVVWDPLGIPDPKRFMEVWNELAHENGLNGFYFIGFTYEMDKCREIVERGFDAVCPDSLLDCMHRREVLPKIKRKVLNSIGFSFPRITSYNTYAKQYMDYLRQWDMPVVPVVLSNFDHTPRSGAIGNVLGGSKPERFCGLLERVIDLQLTKKDDTAGIVLIKSWNEWGEGNYLEPDLANGDAYLTSLQKTMSKYIVE